MPEDNKIKKSFREKLDSILEKRWVAYTLATCSAVLLFMLLSHIKGILTSLGVLYTFISPIVTGIVIAYIINPLCNIIEDKLFFKIGNVKLRHGLAVALGLIFILLLFVLLLGALIPAMIESFSGIAANMDSYLDVFRKYSNQVIEFAARFNLDITSYTDSSEQVFNDLLATVSANISAILSTSVDIGASAVNLLLGFVLAIYFLLDKRNMVAGVRRLRRLILTEKAYESQSEFWLHCHKILGRYIAYDILDGIIIGVANAVFMLIAQMPYVPLISVIVGITNLMPTFGPIFGAVIGGIILALTGTPMQALIFLIFTVVLQGFDGSILKPKLFGDSLGVPAVWILVTIIVGGKIFGIVGILLAIPFAAIFTFVYEEKLIPKLKKRKEERENIIITEEKRVITVLDKADANNSDEGDE